MLYIILYNINIIMSDNENWKEKLKKKLKNIPYKILDTVINGVPFLKDERQESGMYKLYISVFLLILIIATVFISNKSLDALDIKSNKWRQLTILLSSSISLCIFYFFVYRNQYDKNGTTVPSSSINIGVLTDRYYNETTRHFIDDKGTKNVKFNDYLKKYLKIPLFNLLSSLLIFIGTVGLLVLLVGGFFWSFQNYPKLFKVTELIILFIILMILASIVVKILDIKLDDCSNEKGFKGFFCLIKNIFLFIPCLLVILANKVSEDIKDTPRAIYILFIAEIIFVCLFIGLPLLFKYINTINKSDLLNGEGPFYLNNKKYIGTYQQLNPKALTKIKDNYSVSYPINSNEAINVKYGKFGKDKFEYNYTYSLNLNLYIDAQPHNTSLAYNGEAELFNYGNKPVILYDGKRRELIIKSQTENNQGIQLDTIYRTKNIKFQKWMFIVINYGDNTIDVFIDGKLVGSKNNVPPYFVGDKVSFGQDNGIHGSIKDVYYYNKRRPPSDTEFLYKLITNEK